jgi:nitroreductase
MTKPESLTMPIEDAMRTQRAIRRIKSDPVDDDLVLHILELAMKAPTGSNAQNWEFIVVKDHEVKARLARLNRQAFRIYGAIGRRVVQRRGDEKGLRTFKAAKWQADHFGEVPVIVVACLKGPVLPWPSVAVSTAYGSIFPAVQNLLLAARAAGLGAALVTLPLWSKYLARRALGLPWNVTPCAVIPLGWPIGKYGPTTRRPIEELVSLDRYGNRAFLDRKEEVPS